MTVTAALDTLAGQRFALLSWDRETLALPLDVIQSLEAAADVETNAAAAGHCLGHIGKGHARWPVYAAGQHCLSALSEHNPFVVLLKNGKDSYGLLCSRFTLLEPSRVRLYAVPLCMQEPSPALSALLLYDGEVYAIGHTAALRRLIREQTP